MPLAKIQFQPGVNQEVSRYALEGGWYEADKVRFRAGFPEKIGGWARISTNTYDGICRGLFEWATLGSATYRAIGTHTHLYVEQGGQYFDITPVDVTNTLSTDPISVVASSDIVTITDANLNSLTSVGSRVIISGATAVSGITLDGEYTVVEVLTSTTFTVQAQTTAGATATGGGSSVQVDYLLTNGNDLQTSVTGWAAGAWSNGTWSYTVGGAPIRLWSFSNFGEDLIAAVRRDKIYYWSPSWGTNTRAVGLDTLGGASDTPLVNTHTLVSDTSRFMLVFGTNPFDNTSLYDRMLVRWSSQESLVDWTPSAVNQAGDIRLSYGTYISTAIQARQEVLVWTDQALYSMQYIGPPAVWSLNLISNNISIMSSNCATYVEGRAYWMGVDKFYTYDGSVKPMSSTLRKYVFSDINLAQREQCFVGVNEAFGEIWWFYPSKDSTEIDRYVIYNYLDNTWAPGTMGRTAWASNSANEYPIAATYINNVVQHEFGVDDNSGGITQPIASYIRSGEFDLEDGNNFMFVSRILPDIRFDGSTTDNPEIVMGMAPLQNPGAGYTNPLSTSSEHERMVTRTVDTYTGQINIRIRGRHAVFEISSDNVGVQWQLGIPRMDVRPDGKR